MPGFNQKVPNGAGPMTGRGMGKCSGAGIGFSARGMGRGTGRRSGRGRGMGFRASGLESGNDEILMHLKQQKQWIEEEIQRRESEVSN